MKNLGLITILSLLTVSLFTGSAEARRDQIRERNQQNRIKAGVQSGELNKREEKRLNRQQHRLDHAQMRAKSDGVVTSKEQLKLEMRQDQLSKNIFRQKHDEQ